MFLKSNEQYVFQTPTPHFNIYLYFCFSVAVVDSFASIYVVRVNDLQGLRVAGRLDSPSSQPDTHLAKCRGSENLLAKLQF